ncbi:MAG TPA: YwqG family protein [Ktedonobacterales bacterium]|nr:YwqG family protein [Ktedonobacterales bacterium]
MDMASITAAMQQSGLQQVVPALDTLVLPSIRVSTNPSFERAIPPGQSKLGGMPDLPSGVPWPQLKGVPMEFVAQIQLADVHALHAAGPLPAAGLLSFFYDSSQETFGADPNDRLGFKVFYFEQPSSALQRIDLPTDLPAGGRARVCSVTFSEELTLPLEPNLEIPSLAWSDADQERYDAALQQLIADQKHPIHRLLGHPDTIQDDMRTECQFASNGVADPSADPARVAQLTPGALDWILLFQVDSDESIGMRWANAGMLYFWIRREDLAQRHFQNAWVVLQSE